MGAERAREFDGRLLAAVRRLAATAGTAADSAELTERVSEEAVVALGAEAAAIFHYDGDEVVMVGGRAAEGQRMFTRGTRFPIAESPVSQAVRETGRPVCLSAYSEGPGAGPRRVAALGYRTVIGAPITVAGRLWGSATAASARAEDLPPGSEHKLAVLADLCAMALVSAEQVDRLEAQTAEQGALLAVARAVVESADSAGVLPTVAREAAKLLGLTSGALIRFREDGCVVAAEWHAGDGPPRVAMPDPAAELVRECRGVVRVGDPDETADAAELLALGLPVGFGAPIETDRGLWGALVVAGAPGLPVPGDAAERLARFADLSSLAVARVEARAALVRQVVETQQFASLVERSDDFISIAQMDRTVMYVNPAGRRLIGLGPDDDPTRYTIQDLLTPESTALFAEVGRPAIAATGSWEAELELRHVGTGEPIPVSSSSFLVTHPDSGEPLFFATVQRDMRERIAAEQTLSERAAEVEQLAAARRFLLVEALSAEERMRRQIGDALHDDVLQELYAARQDLLEVSGDDEALHRARVAVDAATRQLREAVRDLHPAVSWTRDLEARLRSLLEEGGTRAGFSYELDFAAGTSSDSDDLLLALARELVQNVVKHADASLVRVAVHEEGEGLVLEVEDDGRGMSAERPSEALRGGHIGLASARERVDALGGNFELQSEPGAGTRVRVVVPPGGLRDLAAR